MIHPDKLLFHWPQGEGKQRGLALRVGFYYCFYSSPFLRNCFLCWDHFSGDVFQHLVRPYFVGLGSTLIWYFYS